MFDPTDLLGGPAGWLLVVLVANLAVVLVAQALLVAGLGPGAGFGFGAGRESENGAASERCADASDGAPVPDGRVRCPNCRVENGADYRFCRECLAELPGSGRVGADGPGPRRRPQS